MLISIAFNFLGFVLTYLLHTTHAAKYGSRAGLGITLIQYGWALRSHQQTDVGWVTPDPPPNFDSAADAEAWFAQHAPNATSPDMLENLYQNNYTTNSFTASTWLSFFLMTVGEPHRYSFNVRI